MPARKHREQNRDEPAHDMSIAVAGEIQDGSPRTIRTHRGCKPNLAGATLDLVRVRAVALGQRAQASAKLDDIAVAVVPLLEQRKILDDLVDRHDLYERAP